MPIILDNSKTQQSQQSDSLRQFAQDVLMGLSENRKRISSKYFYDAKGSDLFTEITQLPEYYLFNCEREILQTHKDALADQFGSRPLCLVELGAGDGRKTCILLDHFLKREMPLHYAFIDVSQAAVEGLEGDLSARFPSLSYSALVGDYLDGLSWLDANQQGAKAVLFMGSSIGNFDAKGTVSFLRTLWRHLNRGDFLLIGFDLRKDYSLISKAYNDPLGVHRRFNLNLLTRINRELGGNFDLDQFFHYASYNPDLHAMESFLVSKKEQCVFLKSIQKNFHFNAYESIHVEYSHKYLLSEIESYAHYSGYRIRQHYLDAKQHYACSLWQVVKDGQA